MQTLDFYVLFIFDMSQPHVNHDIWFLMKLILDKKKQKETVWAIQYVKQVTLKHKWTVLILYLNSIN